MANNKVLPDINGNETIASSWERLLTRDRNVSTLFAGNTFTSDQTAIDVGRPNWRTDTKRLYIWNGEEFEPYLEIIDLDDIPFETDNPDIPSEVTGLGGVISTLVRRNLLNTITLPAEGVKYVADGNTYTFNLPRATTNKYSLFIFVDGVKQETSTYDITGNGETVTLKAAPANGEEVEIILHASLTEWDYSPTVDYFTGDGTTTVFNLSFEVLRPETVSVNVEGVELQKTQFNVTDVQQITLSQAPANGASIQIMSTGRTSLVTVSSNSIGTSELKNKSVTRAKLDDGIVFSIDMITASSIVRSMIANGAINDAKLDTGSVTTQKIVNNAVTKAKLATAVQNSLLDVGVVDTQYIADGAVTEAKLANALVNRLEAIEQAIRELKGES